MIKLLDYKNLAEGIAEKRFNFFRMYSDNLTLNDCKQSGFLGLCIAKEKYRDDSNKTFGSFARWYIQGEVMKYIFNNLSIVKVNIKLDMSKVKKYIKKYGEDDLNIMSKYLKIDEVLLNSILDMIHGRNINQSFMQSKKDIYRLSVVDDHRKTVFKEVERVLNPCENVAIVFKFLHGYSDKSICAMLDIEGKTLKKVFQKAKSKLSKSDKLKNIYYNVG